MNIRLIILIFILCPSQKVFSQKPEIHISYDSFWDVYYSKAQIIPDNSKIKPVDSLAEMIISNKVPLEYTFRIVVGTCIYEKKNDSLIDYKRVKYLLNYLEKKYKIDKTKFEINFFTSELCDVEQTDNISIINFALQNCKTLSSNPDIEIFGDTFEDVFYTKNDIIPTVKGRKLLHNIGTAIKNNKISNKYRIRIQVATCDKEEKKNPFIAYERIEYLLNYLEKEFEIKKEKIQFEFIDNKQENKSSYIRFVLLDCK